ncbi:MAG: hypothetical protein ACFFDF_06205, partial [Candidatus Odinarchaeota archaeon]
MNFYQFFWNFNNTTVNSNSSTEPQFFNKLKASDYSSNYGGSGENMKIELHQSYLNNSYNTVLNTSDSNNNRFTLPCPSDTTFNSSYTNFYVEDIYAPNRTLEIETGTAGSESISSNGWAFSFEVKNSCILENFSLAFSDQGTGSQVTVQLYNATYDSGQSRIEPDSNTGLLSQTKAISGATEKWYNFTNLYIYLNVSKTYGKTFFFYVYRSSAPTTYPYIHYQTDSSGDNLDSAKFYRDDRPTDWFLFSRDASTIVNVGLTDNTPIPSIINLQINNSAVSDGSGNFGNWIKNEVYTNPSGNLDFLVTADWWDVTCNVSQVLMNYTRTDLSASSEFNIAGSGQIVEWNVTRTGGLNYFDSRFNNYQINYTIPNTWDKDSLRVFNGAVPKTSDSTNRSLGNGYREVNILNAGNGTFWYLTAESANLVSSINTYKGIAAINIFNFTDIVHFNATFSTDIQNNDGIINLSVYSPALINNELNYSVKIESFIGGSIISLADWDISNNVTQYGDFRVHVFWYNSTAAGFLEKIIKILGETELISSVPKYTFDASETFNIDLFFNDTGLDAGISGADITYRLNNGIIRTDDTDHNNGSYTINIDCNDADFSAYGPNYIEINVSKTYYNNQSEVIEITILGETDLNGSILKSSFDSTEIFNVSLFFNNTVKDIGISGAIRTVYLNSTAYTPISSFDYGDGNYNITIDCDNDYFDSQGYGYFNVSVTVEKPYYYNKSIEFIIYITGETSISTSKYPDP